MTVHETYRDAITSDAPAARLLAGVRQMLDQGYPKDDIVSYLNRQYDALGASGCEVERDAVGDVLDALTGWCAPGAKL